MLEGSWLKAPGAWPWQKRAGRPRGSGERRAGPRQVDVPLLPKTVSCQFHFNPGDPSPRLLLPNGDGSLPPPPLRQRSLAALAWVLESLRIWRHLDFCMFFIPTSSHSSAPKFDTSANSILKSLNADGDTTLGNVCTISKDIISQTASALLLFCIACAIPSCEPQKNKQGGGAACEPIRDQAFRDRVFRYDIVLGVWFLPLRFPEGTVNKR